MNIIDTLSKLCHDLCYECIFIGVIAGSAITFVISKKVFNYYRSKWFNQAIVAKRELEDLKNLDTQVMEEWKKMKGG